MKKFKLYIISIIILVAISAIVLTYSYFSPQIMKPDSNNSIIIHAADFDTSFVTSEYINVTEAMPISDSEKESKAAHTDFSITLLSNQSINYNILLTNINISNNLKSADFKWELLENNVIIASDSFLNINDLTEIKLNNDLLTISSGTNDYILRIWISSTDENQNDLLGGTFSGKVKVVSVEA